MAPRHQSESDSIPADAYRMPAEWEPHERCWMMWPTRAEIWNDIAATRRAFAAAARTIRLFEPVTMVVSPADAMAARALLGPAIDVLEAPIDDSWCRDAGPCFLLDGKGDLAGVDFCFNAWGGKYQGYANDAAVAARILAAAGAERIGSRLVAEGGGVTVDGEGTLITTLSCFPNSNRNPDWDLAEIEDELKRCLGVRKVIWLPGNSFDTETDGHVDGVAVFARPGLVLVQTTDDKSQPEYQAFAENLEALRGQTDAKGRPLQVMEVKSAVGADSTSMRFCRSYVNFYMANGALIMPCYGVEEDRATYRLFSEVFPERKIVPLVVDDIAFGGGGIHCITQQQPRRN
ncbi:agmatine deiminase family protein [Limibacillus halophilus]|uniref:Agmatine deiminase n=1 Tax=Limibacillus halophilus TaxID=1579333 RepID=A0A839SR97_9PROT|nr:agmatine deiminase family protein [Limibacillus halophilus]MBB3064260.1 agmatine deiminase [Limibacillus halophilus]